MKALLSLIFIFVLATTLLAQHDGYRYVGYNGQTLPPSDLTLADVVDILTEYNIVHQDRIVGGPYWGMTEFDKKRITLDDSPDQALRRNTVIHELLHVWYLRQANMATGGYDSGEAAIALETGKIYEKLFVKLALPPIVEPPPADPAGTFITVPTPEQ